MNIKKLLLKVGIFWFSRGLNAQIWHGARFRICEALDVYRFVTALKKKASLFHFL